ncbi:hypothetical protein ACFE04_006590 [Oxalis oulophora]
MTTTESPPSSPPSSPRPENKRTKTQSPISDSYVDCCGICLLSSDDENTLRGYIDSCNHYYCYTCILEWAKVESRCPLCKARFTTVTRPPKQPSFWSQRIVQIPKRDQPYFMAPLVDQNDNLGDQTMFLSQSTWFFTELVTDRFDNMHDHLSDMKPATISWTHPEIWNSLRLLERIIQGYTLFVRSLLCRGTLVYHLLGNATVGPSDQYSTKVCSVCSINEDDCLLLLCDLCDTPSHTYCVGLGATVPEGDWFCHDCSVSKSIYNKTEQDDGDVSNSEANVSIFDIVSDQVVERTTNQGCVANELTESSSRPSQNIASSTPASGSRTLRRCENVQNRVRLIRENWDGLRNGSLRFSSGSVESGLTSQRKVNTDKVQCNNSTSSVSNNQQLHIEASAPIVQSATLRDIDKSWKMLDIAKSIKRRHESASNIRLQDSKQKGISLSMGKAPNLNQNLNIAKSQHRVGDVKGTLCEARKGRSSSQDEYNYLQSRFGANKYSSYEKQKHSGSSSKKINTTLSTTNPTGYLETPLKYRDEIEREAYKVRGLKHLPRDTHGSPSRLPNEHGMSSSPMALVRDKLEKSLDTNKRKVGFGKHMAESNSKTSYDAKIEIQSLVKLNLKPLTKEKRLGIDEFKEVARVCTHTILAACGLEHRKSEARPFPSCVCSHTNEIQQLNKSSLMSNCCRECFDVFVKDTVNYIMTDRTGHRKLC